MNYNLFLSQQSHQFLPMSYPNVNVVNSQLILCNFLIILVSISHALRISLKRY